ncbi:hypothetical protein FZEAL_2640 [Fusarium zealandicum]|uniref:Uncharacterized protein n=1 Tax=Fusarium zealandicum TaxID=1053134 RepID=A0A8H4UQE8_9HYPO|nr:hypothetical protein FZEAL_2640 [Fusarium zealandicum]
MSLDKSIHSSISRVYIVVLEAGKHRYITLFVIALFPRCIFVIFCITRGLGLILIPFDGLLSPFRVPKPPESVGQYDIFLYQVRSVPGGPIPTPTPPPLSRDAFAVLAKVLATARPTTM